MSKERDLQSHFTAMLGRDIARDGLDEVTLREAVASYSVSDGLITSREIGTTGASTRGCGRTSLVDISGVARSGQDGKVEFLLSDFFCPPHPGYEPVFQSPVNLIATPRSDTPAFLTVLRFMTSDRRDVKITVFTWGANGSPLSNVSFDWRCRVPYDNGFPPINDT
jgi:hypothetical protein